MAITIDKRKDVRYNVRIGGDSMLNTSITNLRKNLFSFFEQTIKFNEPVNVTTKEGNAVIISEEEYNNMMETMYLLSVPGMKEKVLEGLQTPLSECVPESEVEW